MKKKLIRKLRILFVGCLLLFCLLAGMIFYAYQHTFALSPAFTEKIRAFISSSYNLDFQLDEASFNVGRHTLKIKNIRLNVLGDQPFLKADQANIFLASGTGILDYYFARAVVERVELVGVTIDQRYGLPAGEKTNENPFKKIPVSEIHVAGLNIQTETMCLTFQDFNAELVKGLKHAGLSLAAGTGPFGGEMSLKGMISLEDKESTLRLAWKHGNLALFTPLALIKHLYGISLADGSLAVNIDWNGDIAARLAEPKKDFLKFLNEELKGKIELKSSLFSWQDFSGPLTLVCEKKDAEPWSLSLEQTGQKSSVKINGRWLGQKDSMDAFSAEIQGSKIKFGNKLLEIAGITVPEIKPGPVDVDARIGFSAGRFAGNAFLHGHDWSYRQLHLESASISLSLEEKSDKLKILADILSSQGKVALNTDVEIYNSFNASISANLNQIELSLLQPLLEFAPTGVLSGSLQVALSPDRIASVTYKGKLNLKGFSFENFSPEFISAEIEGSGKNWCLRQPSAEFSDGGKIWLEGMLSPEKLDAKAFAENVNLFNFSVPERIVAGEASLRAVLSGSLTDPVIDGEVWGSGLQVIGRDISTIKSQIHLGGGILDLSPLVIKPEKEGQIDGYYSFSLADGDTRSFKLNFQQLGLEFVRDFFPASYLEEKLGGQLGGSVTFNNQKKENFWDFLVEGRALQLFDQDIESLFLEGSILGEQGEIRNLFVRSFGGKLNLSGQVLSLEKFDGSIEAEGLMLEKINMLSRAVPGIRGKLDFQGNIEWNGDEKKGYFTLFGDKIKVNERELGNLGGELVIDNLGMRILNAEFDRLGVSLSGNVTWAGRKPYQAELSLKDVDLSFLTQAHGIKTFDTGGLKVDGQCSVSGDLASLTPDVVEMQLETIKIQKENDVIVSNRPMQLKFQNDSLEVRSLELKYRQGILGIEGILNPGADSALVIRGKDFSLRALGRLLDLPDWSYDGSLSANATVFGLYPQIKLRADAQIDNFEIADRKIDGLTARVSGDSLQLDLEEFKVKLPASSFELKGKINHRDFLELTKVDLSLKIPEGPITDLPKFLPSIFRQASGTIHGDLKLIGDPSSPQISGELQLNAAELGFSGMGKPLKNVDFALSTRDSIINIDRMQANLGRGTLKGSGNINFRDGPGSITARLTGEKIDLAFLNFEIERASAAADISGNLYNPEIYGNVLVPRGKFNITTDLLKDRPGLNLFLNSLKYHINVEVPRNFWLKSSFLNAEMKGRFSVMGDLDKVHLDGGISSVQGWLYFQQRKFRIDTGEIKFGGVEDSFDPQIFIKSEGQVQNTQVFLTLQGRVSSFTPKIYSSPPMSEGDLLALLTLGRDMTSAMQSDTRELFENEILDGLKNSYISALIGNTISAALNLDELFLTSLYDKTEGRSRSFIRAGKYIGRNIFMAYEGTLDESEEETFIFEYRLPKGFVVNLEFEEPEKDKRIGVRYDWKFW